MQATALEIYALSVCFVTVLAFAISLCISFYNVIQLAIPIFMMDSWEYKRHHSNHEFWNAEAAKHNGTKQRPSEQELTKEREDSFAHAVVNRRHDAAQSLVKVMVFASIDAELFFVHWALAHNPLGRMSF